MTSEPTADGGHQPLADLRSQVERGGAPGYPAANVATGEFLASERVALLLDADSFVEDGLSVNPLVNALVEDLPADGVITGTGLVDGRPVCVMANDSTVMAGSWGARTVEKIIRILETAYRTRVPMVWLIDAADARIADQADLLPGRRGAGKIRQAQVRASGTIPQVCGLFGPSAAGGGYLPAFCDPVLMGPVLMDATVIDLVLMDAVVMGEQDVIATLKRYLAYFPDSFEQEPPTAEPVAAKVVDLRALVPASDRQAFDMRHYLSGLVDEGSFLEVHALWARELTVGYGRLDGQVIGVLGNNSMFQGGELFIDAADKADRFIQTCDAFNIPLLFLSDVPGFLVDPAVERQGIVRPEIIRQGAKMITTVHEATVPTISVIVRQAAGAGLYELAGPGFEPDACLALPTAKIAVTGAQAAAYALYAKKIASLSPEEQELFGDAARADIDIGIDRLANELVVDALVQPEDLRAELIRRYAGLRGKDRSFSRRPYGISPG